MRIIDIRTLWGANIFADFPVLRMTLDLGDLTDVDSTMLPGFTERLLALLPGLHGHHCSRGRHGGFVERLVEGTYLGHITEHVAIELSTPSGIEISYGKTVYAGQPGHYHVVVEFENEAAMRHLLETAVELVEALIEGRPYDVAEAVVEAKRLVRRTALGPSTRALTEAATARGIPWERLNEASLLVLGHGKYRRFLQAATSSRTSFVAVEVASDKQLTKNLLSAAGVPVPAGKAVRDADEAVRAYQELGAPVVVKPLDGNHGNGVSMNLASEGEVRAAFEVASEFSADVLVERMVRGKNYRVMVVGGEVVAASERQPAQVVGDGVHSVRELIELENQNPLRGEGHDNVLTKLEVDAVVEAFLRKAGRSLDDVPHEGEVFTLRDSINLSTGGTARDVTDELHPLTVKACQRAARAIDLDICGIDLVTEDIRQPLEGWGAVIELNAAPGLRMHEHPSHGKPRPVAARIIDWLFPKGHDGRIPIVSITGTNGKTTCARLVAHALSATGLTVGSTSTDGIYIGQECVQRGDTTGPASAKRVLSDPEVDVAVLETARGGLVRRGLGYDWADVGVITNITADHLGQDGIETVEDLLRIKSVVAERVREHGTLVLNADDPLLHELPTQRRVARTPKRVVFFSLDRRSAFVSRHVQEGGAAYVADDGLILELSGDEVRVVADVASIPLTQAGDARFQVANVLAAVAACRAQGMHADAIAWALQSFDPNAQNPGRMNLFRLTRGYAVIDYGHNPGAIDALATLARSWRGRRVTIVASLPGDRDPELLTACGQALARGFDRVLLKDDRDLRGRAPGETPELVAAAIRSARPDVECTVVPDEWEAIRMALDSMMDEEVIVLLSEEVAQIGELLREWGAMPVQSIGPVTPRSGVRPTAFEETPLMLRERAG